MKNVKSGSSQERSVTVKFLMNYNRRLIQRGFDQRDGQPKKSKEKLFIA